MKVKRQRARDDNGPRPVVVNNDSRGTTGHRLPSFVRAASSCPAPRPPQSGHGRLKVSVVQGRSVVTRSESSSPFRWLIPRRRSRAVWAYSSTYGGGLVAGDRIDLDVQLSPGALCAIGTQSSTKVYRNPGRPPCRQTLRASVGEEATLVMAPDPVTCFADASYEQAGHIDLQPGGSLVLVDWLTSGRRARGERWAFSRYRSRWDVFRDGRRVLTDALLLDAHDGPLDGPYRLGRFNCLATVVILGGRFDRVARNLLDAVESRPVERRSSFLEAASPIEGGVIWRMLGETTEQVGRRLKEGLAFLADVLEETPWSRKW